MAIFPDIAPSYNYPLIPNFLTEKAGPTDGDVTQRRRSRLVPLYSVALQYESITAANERTLFEFFLARFGSWDDFTFCNTTGTT